MIRSLLLPVLTASAVSSFPLAAAGILEVSSYYGMVRVRNTGDAPLTWNAQGTPGLSAQPGSGTLAPGDIRFVSVRRGAWPGPAAAQNPALTFTGSSGQSAVIPAPTAGEWSHDLGVLQLPRAVRPGGYLQDVLFPNTGESPFSLEQLPFSDLRISPVSFTVAPGGQQSVVLSWPLLADAASLPEPGTYYLDASLQAPGPVPVAASLRVQILPDAPGVVGLPATASAALSSVLVEAGAGVSAYQVQVAQDGGFLSPQVSAWSSSPLVPLPPLTPGQWFFRARHSIQSGPAAFALSLAGEVWREGFEQTGTGLRAARISSPLPAAIPWPPAFLHAPPWAVVIPDSGAVFPVVSSTVQGLAGAAGFGAEMPVIESFGSVSVQADLTGAAAIRFRVGTRPDPLGSAELYSLALQVDGQTVWQRSPADVLPLTVQAAIPVAAGVREVKWVFANTDFALIGGQPGFEVVDCVAVGAGFYPAEVAFAEAVSVHPARRPGLLRVDADTPPGTSVAVDFVDLSGLPLAVNVAPGTDLGTIGNVREAPGFIMHVKSRSTDPAVSPLLRSCRIDFTSTEEPLVSGWGPVAVSSLSAASPMLDAGPLVRVSAGPLGLLDGFLTGREPLTLTVNGEPVPRAGTRWATAVPLSPGLNQFTISAQDGAAPPGTSSASVSVYLAAPGSDYDADGLPDLWELRYGLDAVSAAGAGGAAGDPDQDGRTNFAEYAFASDPRLADRQVVTIAAAGGGLRVSWFRPVESTCAYGVFSSTDLTQWEAVQQAVTSAPAGDTVVMSMEVPQQGSGPVFFRVRAVRP